MKGDPLDLIAQKISGSHRIAITSHLRPDGDSICTGLALFFLGEALGLEMAFINKDKTPFPFNHFPESEKIKIGQVPPDYFDIIILLECANVPRSGQDRIDGYFKINIDHHHSNDFYADINWVDPEAAAVGCMIFKLTERLGVSFSPVIANHLYCAIVSDTGSFQFSNTNAEALEICSKLLSRGAEHTQVAEQLFNTNPPEKIKLLGRVLSTLELNEKGNIALITMHKTFLDSKNLKEIDTEDITTLARSIKGVQIVLFFKEINKNEFRVSIRSKGNANAAQVAEEFGGGGHQHAAGFTVYGEYDNLINEVPEKVSLILNHIFND